MRQESRSWFVEVYRGYISSVDDKRNILYAEFEDEKKATAKQAALTKVLKAEDSPFAGKVNIERRGDRVYLEKK